MIGTSILDLFPKDTAIRFAKNNKEVIETGKSKFIEEKMVVNGKEFYNNTILNPIKDSKGNVVAVMGIVRDVTERKMAEERIKESENMYRTLFESSSDAIMMIAPPTWRFTSGNPSTIKMFKARDEKDFTSIGPWDVSPKYQPDGQLSTAKAKKMIMKAMRTGKNFFEWTHKRINGEDFPATVLLTRIELGGKKMIQATVRDISELKITQEKIEAQNRFLSSIFEAVNNPFYVIDAKNYKVLKANFAAHMGKLANETTCYAMTHKRDTPCNSKTDPCPLEIVKKTKKPTVVEHVHYIDGKQRIVEVHGYPILDAKGDVIQMIEQGLDITERKKAEEKLKESEKSYKDLVENIGFPVIITDKMGKILFMNDIGAKKLGLKHENVIGKNIYQLFPKKEADGKLRIVKTVIRTKKKVVLEYPSTFKNKTVWHEAHIFPVRDTVGNTNAEIVTYDITRRKELEEKIKKIKKVSFF
jgi:PAS domain S-box-containing protein